jgi:hypothetical protein
MLHISMEAMIISGGVVVLLSFGCGEKSVRARRRGNLRRAEEGTSEMRTRAA